MMAAYIIESAQLPIVAAHDHDRLARHVCGEELALLAKLVGASYDLPGGAKHAAALQFCYPRVAIPQRWNRKRLLQRRRRIVQAEYVVKSSLHLQSSNEAKIVFIPRKGKSRKRKVLRVVRVA